jgi:hypothetical protein
MRLEDDGRVAMRLQARGGGHAGDPTASDGDVIPDTVWIWAN